MKETSVSAIWMLPLRNAYGKWPASGEIDIVEARGRSTIHIVLQSKDTQSLARDTQ